MAIELKKGSKVNLTKAAILLYIRGLPIGLKLMVL